MRGAVEEGKGKSIFAMARILVLRIFEILEIFIFTI